MCSDWVEVAGASMMAILVGRHNNSGTRALGRVWAILGGLGLCLAVSVAAMADPVRLERTDPNHLAPKVSAPLDLPPWPQRIMRDQDRMAYQFPGALEKWAKLDKRLTHLCGRGAFRQQRHLALYALADNATYGVALAGGANLHDPQSLAKPDTVYFFAQPETSHCIVLTAPQDKVASFAMPRPR